MSGRGALQHEVAALRQEVADLKRYIGNLPVRWPVDSPDTLHVDHDEHEDSTPVSETGVAKPGYLHDVWKVIKGPGATRQSSTSAAPNKVATTINQFPDHDEGWVWGNKAYEWRFGTQSKNNAEPGWGRWADIIGIEDEGGTYVNFMTWGRWNNGKEAPDRKVGPIYFDDFDEGIEVGGPQPWYLGKMIFDGWWWRPAFKMGGGVSVSTRGTMSPVDKPVDHDDHCPVFTISPDRYVKLENFTVIAAAMPGVSVNVHKVAACNRDEINGIWRHLAVLDWHAGDIMGWHDNWLDTMWGSRGLHTAMVGSLQQWCARVTSILNDMTLNFIWATLNWDMNNLLAVTPYVPQCPLPAGHAGDYNEPAMLECQQLP